MVFQSWDIGLYNTANLAAAVWDSHSLKKGVVIEN